MDKSLIRKATQYRSGVYSIWVGETCLYVGASTNLYNRINEWFTGRWKRRSKRALGFSFDENAIEVRYEFFDSDLHQREREAYLKHKPAMNYCVPGIDKCYIAR